ncbi:MAG: hypothetical protein JST80_03195 [Bdellovibrionales bacterium]|nr:hypothetical protein [Bdellovibrionales bacterium]
MKNFTALTFLLILSMPVLAANKKPSDEDMWFKCNHDKDCGITNNSCGWPVGVNLDHLFEYQKAATDPNVVCDEYKGPGFDQLRPICKKHKCVLIEKKPKRSRKKPLRINGD